MSHAAQLSVAARQSGMAESRLPPGRLLIVDDMPDNRAVLSRRFRPRGFETVEADCGEDALRLVEEQTFDCVLLDVMMPGMDGTEVLRQIRQKFSASVLPVIMVTARCQSEDVIEALRYGANDYVTKPVDFAVALTRVNVQIGRRRAELEHVEASQTLLNANSKLEQRVAERNAKLLQANAAMREEASRRQASEEKIAHLARHDALTGLPNRFSFDEKINAATKFPRDAGAEISLLFIDLDGFKNINDTLGHGVGDELLKQVAASLRGVIGAKDFCARLGGDEFAILHVSEDARETARTLADKIIAAVSAGHVVGGNEVFVGVSIGVSLAAAGVDTATLLKQADLAMYRAKAEGRGVARFFEAEMGRLAEVRRSLELDLRKAVANADLQLYYQPIVDLRTREVAGAEALMRWSHAMRGFVPPAEFIPLAEETGLIIPMGEWALRRACADAARWPASMRVAVNLSAVQFRTMSLISAVADALAASGLAADRLELEITESVVLGNNAQNLTILKRLRDLGVRLALDDFGAGFSGLGYIRAFQFDRVKIDRSFIRDMRNHPESLAIIRAAIGLGEDLGICTTAEGVETHEQLECLLSEGCDEVQGFWFSKAQPNANLAGVADQIWRDSRVR